MDETQDSTMQNEHQVFCLAGDFVLSRGLTQEAESVTEWKQAVGVLVQCVGFQGHLSLSISRRSSKSRLLLYKYNAW